MSPAMAAMANTNAAFSQLQWEIAKQDGCQPCAAQAFPQWPPRNNTAFTYPMLQSTEEVAGMDTARYGTPYNPTAAEIAGADPASLACAVPQALRQSAFLPAEPTVTSAAEAFVIPDVQLDASDESKPYNPPPTPTVEVVTDDAPPAADPLGILDALRGVWHDLTHWDAVPGDDAMQKLIAVATRDGRPRALLLLLLLIAATTLVLSVLL